MLDFFCFRYCIWNMEKLFFSILVGFFFLLFRHSFTGTSWIVDVIPHRWCTRAFHNQFCFWLENNCSFPNHTVPFWSLIVNRQAMNWSILTETKNSTGVISSIFDVPYSIAFRFKHILGGSTVFFVFHLFYYDTCNPRSKNSETIWCLFWNIISPSFQSWC